MAQEAAVSERAFTERAVTFARGGERLTGVLSLPARGCAPVRCGDERACLVLHGWASSRVGPHRVLVDLARSLAARGMPALRFDHAGRGDSTGAFLDADLDSMIDDALAAAALLRRETGAGRLAAFGLCSGGNVAIGAAGLDPGIDRLVCVSTLPFQSERPRAADRARRAARALHLARRLLSPRAWGRLLRGRTRLAGVLDYLFGRERGAAVRGTPDGETRNLKDSRRDLAAAFRRWPGEVLFVYGGADPEGAAGWDRVWAPVGRERGLAIGRAVVEGANHNFYNLCWRKELIGRAADFLCGGHHPAERGGDGGDRPPAGGF